MSSLFQPDPSGRVRVHAKYSDGTAYSDEFDTVIFAIGRDAETAKLGLDKVLNLLKLLRDKRRQYSEYHLLNIKPLFVILLS